MKGIDKAGKYIDVNIPTLIDNYRIRYGTVDASRMDSLWIDFKGWIKVNEKFNYLKEVNNLRNKIKIRLKEIIDIEVFHNNFIICFDVYYSGLELNGRAFMELQVTLFINTGTSIHIDSFKNSGGSYKKNGYIKTFEPQVYDVVLAIDKILKEKNNFEYFAKKINKHKVADIYN